MKGFERWAPQGVFAPIDLHLARTLGRLVPGTADEVLLAAALASRAVQQGHVCVDLRQAGGTTLVAPEDAATQTPRLPAWTTWEDALKASPLVAQTLDDREPKPLVLDSEGRLYLYRYARYQQRLVDALALRAAVMEAPDLPLLGEGLQRLFAAGDDEQEQRHAAAVAVLRRFSIISGGPGTGKTFTVARILALLQEQALAATNMPLRVKALAPTGKAAQRLVESLTAAVTQLACSERVRETVLTAASTIHRALGYQPQTPTRFRHGPQSPLPADVVLVDEASMVDLALMTKLAEAVSPHARLILLGDKDQLASVEAGSILADIYSDQSQGVSAPMAQALQAVGVHAPRVSSQAPGLADGCIHLSRSRRYDEQSGIGALARAVKAGDGKLAVTLSLGQGNVALHASAAQGLDGQLENSALSALANLRSLSPDRRLDALARFKILCAHRRGPAGAERINAQMESLLAAHNVIEPRSLWYDGRPILITANDPDLDLFNGDVGVICDHPVTGAPLAHFAATGDSKTRAIAPARLPPHETVFAMTVHKSQGSEFDHVALLLPEVVSPVLTRELIYTAITRARLNVDIYGAPEILEAAVARRVQRASGLKDALNAPVGS